MKIALVGNMNNNFFSLLRYFVELKQDADLFVFKNEFEHFSPQADTYEFEKYQKHIKKLTVSNSFKGFFQDINEFKVVFDTYDIVIGCGIMPMVAKKLHRKLDIFVPYGDAFELTTVPNNTKMSRWLIIKYLSLYQVKAIRDNVKFILTIGVNKVSQNAIDKFDVKDKVKKLFFPMVFNKAMLLVDPDIDKYIRKMRGFDLVVFSHTRHMWKNFTEKHHSVDGGKGLDKLIIGFSKYLTENNNSRSLLVLFDYGKDVEDSKRLIKEHGIDNNVLWVELMERKKILQLIDYADIVVDALGSKMWGGVGYEGLSRGKMIMQNIEISPEDFKKITGVNLPYIFNVNTSDGVCDSLVQYSNNKDKYFYKSKVNQQWFDENAGIYCAEKYLDLCREIYREKDI